MRGALSKKGGANASLAGTGNSLRVTIVRWNPKGLPRSAGS